MAVNLIDIGLVVPTHLKNEVKVKHLLVMLMLGTVLWSCASPKTPVELEAMLRPYYQIHQPSGDGPFPAVMVLHGGEGQSVERGHSHLWAQWLTTQGYVAVDIDSFSPRNVTEREVSTGAKLWGNERASDVLVTLAYLKTLPFVDPEKIAVIGFSHGGWAALDSLSLAPPQKLPSGLTEAPPGGLEGLRAVVAFYPWCKYPAAHRKGWESKIPVLFLLAGADTVVSTSSCKQVAEAQKANGHPVEYYIYPDATHDFDNPNNHGKCCSFDPDCYADAKNRVRRFLEKSMR
jgi:dienelactone hydrolase